VRIITGIAEIDELTGRLTDSHPLVESLEELTSEVRSLTISPKTRGIDRLGEMQVRSLVGRGVRDRELAQIGRVTGLEELQLTDLRTNDLRALAGLHDLRILTLSACARLESLAGIEGATRLELLSVWSAPKLRSIDAVASLPALRVVFLSGGMYRPIRVASLQPLANATQLVSLRLSSLRVRDRSLAPLHGLRRLRRLALPSYFPASEFTALALALPDAMGNRRASRRP
jgi:hypothetical protein